MKQITSDVVVIGGGATGTGLVRDLAMRGLKTLLVERRDLSHGTTGKHHGLLHSGGRYVVKDPQAAQECYDENKILRLIMPHCIEDTGGFFVLTPWDDPGYVQPFLEGCRHAGIPVEELSISHMLKQEPKLNPHISRCFRVPDGTADPFLAAELNAESARHYNATILTYHEVLSLVRDHNHVTGILCQDLVKDEQVQVNASIVVNASGAWAGKIAASAGITIQMIPGKGTLAAVNHRIVNTVINRCKMPSDGDILVPTHTVSIMGTTDIKVNDPDYFSIEPWELRLLLEEGEKLIPDFRSFRLLRAWAGVRPLFQETSATSSDREISRAYVLLDHVQRDGIEGLLTITSGKWTTYRKMAEVTADKVCEKLGLRKQCRTHLEILPTRTKKESIKLHYHQLGARLAEIENQKSYGKLLCECELVTLPDIEHDILQNEVHTLGDIRRDLRLGMGPCQGGYCTLRAAGLLHALRQPPVEEINTAICDFLEERWKGQLPILWGHQLRQVRLNELIYKNVLNVDNLPGKTSSRFAIDKYATPPPEQVSPPSSKPSQQQITFISHPSSKSTDVLVIGAGLAGLVTAWRSLYHKKNTRLIAKGWGATHWSSGCIDVLNNQSLEAFVTAHPTHPYTLAGSSTIRNALTSFQDLCASASYPMLGSIEEGLLLPTALGSLRMTNYAPITMVAGDTRNQTPMLIVGFSQFLDFFPSLIAKNLQAQSMLATDLTLDLVSLQQHKYVSGMVLARLFDTPEFRAEVVTALRNRLGEIKRIGFPAVLGLNEPLTVIRDLENQLGVQVFEIPGLPPSIPGIRLHNLLTAEIQKLGGRIYNGMQVTGFENDAYRISAVYSEAAARHQPHAARTIILATGGLLGGGIQLDDHGYAQDTALGLPINCPTDRTSWHYDTFLSSEPHPLHNIGFAVNSSFQPIDQKGALLFDNLYVVGGALGGFDPIHEHSLEGVSLVTGYLVGEKLA